MVSLLKYGSSFASTETSLISFRIIDQLYQPMMLRATISNQNGAISTRYSPFDEIQIVENTTNLILFRGRIESIDSPTNPQYGQVLEIVARDNLQELAKRTMRDGTYSANGRGGTSGLIKEIVEDHRATAANIVLSSGSTMEASADTGTKTVRYKNSGKTALKAITEEAQADPWGSFGGDDNSGYAFYLGTNLYLYYFKLGSEPSDPASNGLTVQYGLTTPTDTAKQMMAAPVFSEPGRQVVTHCTAHWIDQGGIPKSLFLQRWTHGTVTNPPFHTDVTDKKYQGGARLVNSAGALVGRVQHREDGAILVSHVDAEDADPSQNIPPLWAAGQTVTQQADVTTGSQPYATLTTSPFLATKMIISKNVRGHDFVDTSADREGRRKAIEAAATVLRKGFDVTGLVEGQFRIVGYPEHKQGSTWYAVRAGHQIKVTNTVTANVNDNMTVQKIEHEQGPGRMDSTIWVVSVTEGNDYTTSLTSSLGSTAVNSGQQVPSAIGEMPAAVSGAATPELGVHIRPADSPNNRTRVSWDVGQITYTDGFVQSVLSGTSNNSSYINGEMVDTTYDGEKQPYVMYVDRSLAQTDLLKFKLLEVGNAVAAEGTTTTLATGIFHNTTEIVLADGASFAENDIVKINDELIKLGSKSTHTFTGCTRAITGANRTDPNPHQSGVTVAKQTLTPDGSFVVPKEVLGIDRVILGYVMAGDDGTSPASDAKIILTSDNSYFNQRPNN